MHLPPFLLGLVQDHAMTCECDTGDLLYSAISPQLQRDRSTLVFFFFFFFFLSIAQRIGSKPPPSHMKVLSFVRDVRTFEMTPYKV